MRTKTWNAITFTVEGQPMAQQRAGRKRIGNFIHTFDPKQSASYKDTVRLCFAEARGRTVFKRIEEGPVRLIIVARFDRPASKCSKRERKPEEWMEGGKDGDNIAKIIQDALNYIAWKDDRQVADLQVRKYLCAQGTAPSVEIWIESIPKNEETPISILGEGCI